MVEYKVDGHFAVLWINNPPVNALSSHVKSGLVKGIQEAERSQSVQCVVIIGKGRTFPAGADIREFKRPIEDSLPDDIISTLETCTKPVISAIHGTCLGGGLEIALGSHYRIAVPTAKFGFPEVNIGICPGWEGTVRLPRLCGISVGLDLIVTGRHISANEALKFGILDKIVEGDLLTEAKHFAATVSSQSLEKRRISQIKFKHIPNEQTIIEESLANIKRQYKGLKAPIMCWKLVKFASEHSFDEAVANERKTTRELMTGSEARALQYAFFSDRLAPKWKLPSGSDVSNTKPLAIKSVGVIGAGTMGSGIAFCLIRSGFQVKLVEKNQQMLKKALGTIDLLTTEGVRRGKMSVDQKRNSMKRLEGVSTLDHLKNVDLVIEAVFENLALKKDIFSQLDKICKSETILCSNTSTLDIDKIASATTRKDKVIGTHFFAPAHIMKLLENVYGSDTSPATVATVMNLGKAIGKTSVLVKTCDGFVANRMNLIGTEAQFLIEEGAFPEEVDRVLEDFGMAMGVFKVLDLSGNDVSWRVRQERAKAKGIALSLSSRYNSGERYCSIADRLHSLGRHGQKTGKGWYRYDKPFSRMSYPDQDVHDMIVNHCRELGIQRRRISPQEILERCLFASINEGFHILEERVADKPQDIDVIWLYGFNFPRSKGGPMYYASQVGLRRVYERVCYYQTMCPESSHWVPSDLLRKLASHTKDIPMDEWTKFISSPSAYSRL